VISEEKKKLGLLDLATQLKLKQQDFAAKQGIKLHGELKDRKGSEGICHAIVLESYALPGQLILARTRTRRTWARLVVSLLALEPRMCSIAGSRKMCG